MPACCQVRLASLADISDGVGTSALTPKADIQQRERNVRFRLQRIVFGGEAVFFRAIRAKFLFACWQYRLANLADIDPNQSMRVILGIFMRLTDRILEPVERLSEILFGLIMALTITGAVGVATADRF